MSKVGQDNYRARHRKAGLCIRCASKKYKAGLCSHHYTESKKYSNDRRMEKLAEEGFPNGKTKCSQCHQLGHNKRTCNSLTISPG